MSTAPLPSPIPAPVLSTGAVVVPGPRPAPASRLASVDLVRGFVMVLMVLDHARLFLTEARFDPLDLDRTTTGLFLTRWITHFCAPVFVLLAGVSASLSGARRGDRRALSRFLLARGAWLVLLEVIVVNAGWAFNLRFESGVILQVIWAIGMSMIALAGLVWLPKVVIAGVAIALVAGHNAFDGVAPAELGGFGLPWALLHVSGRLVLGGIEVFALYPLLPWIGVLALGYVLGDVFRLPDKTRRGTLAGLGLTLVALFVVLRATGAYGDPRPWRPQPDAWRAVLSFLDVAKYPPSLLYVAMTIGPALVALAAVERLRGPLAHFLVTLGRVPLFFYVAHIYLVHAIGMAAGTLQGFAPAAFGRDFLHLPPGYGFGLGGVYVGWLLAVALLWAPSRWFAGVKARSRSPWMSYL